MFARFICLHLLGLMQNMLNKILLNNISITHLLCIRTRFVCIWLDRTWRFYHFWISILTHEATKLSRHLRLLFSSLYSNVYQRVFCMNVKINEFEEYPLTVKEREFRSLSPEFRSIEYVFTLGVPFGFAYICLYFHGRWHRWNENWHMVKHVRGEQMPWECFDDVVEMKTYIWCVLFP